MILLQSADTWYFTQKEQLEIEKLGVILCFDLIHYFYTVDSKANPTLKFSAT